MLRQLFCFLSSVCACGAFEALFSYVCVFFAYNEEMQAQRIAYNCLRIFSVKRACVRKTGIFLLHVRKVN